MNLEMIHVILIYNIDIPSSLEIHVTCQQNPQTTIPTSTEDITSTTIKARETTTPTQSQDRTTTIQSRESTTPTQSLGTTTAIRSRETTTINISGYSTQGQEVCQQQGYTLSAVVVPLVVTILLIAVTVVGHVILYRRRLGLIKQPECSEAVTSQHATYDSLDLSKVEPPNVYADTSTGQVYVNTAIES
ncbi:uncharacterized protein LOC117327716 [Pecten maximus]|uniref:uncharacterized protein LOC117327716 n=1 Tax=Pecten maximus TaxID=6579 RepID=UPI00145837BC|nr:uncharacterized protein LOC117327716 [Pecten maximus]